MNCSAFFFSVHSFGLIFSLCSLLHRRHLSPVKAFIQHQNKEKNGGGGWRGGEQITSEDKATLQFVSNKIDLHNLPVK